MSIVACNLSRDITSVCGSLEIAFTKLILTSGKLPEFKILLDFNLGYNI